MSKELEAVKYLKENKRRHWINGDRSQECLDSIETALKDLNTIKECISFNSFGDLVLTQYGKVHYDLLREVLR